MKKIIISLIAITTLAIPAFAIVTETNNFAADAYKKCYNSESFEYFRYCFAAEMAADKRPPTIVEVDLPTRQIVRYKYAFTDGDKEKLDLYTAAGQELSKAASYCNDLSSRYSYGKTGVGKCYADAIVGATENIEEVRKNRLADSLPDKKSQDLSDKYFKTKNGVKLPSFVYNAYNSCLSTSKSTHAFFACTINKITAFNGDFDFDVYVLPDKELFSKLVDARIKHGDFIGTNNGKKKYFSPKDTFLDLVDQTSTTCSMRYSVDDEYLSCFKRKAQNWTYYEGFTAGRNISGNVRYLDSPFK